MRRRQIHAKMTEAQSTNEEFEGYQFSVEFMKSDDRDRQLTTWGECTTNQYTDLWCKQDFILFLPLETLIPGVRGKTLVSSQEYVSWQLAQADNCFLLDILTTIGNWHEPVSKLIDYWVSKYSKSGEKKPHFLDIKSISKDDFENAFMLLNYLRQHDLEDFCKSLATACLNYESGYFAGLKSAPPVVDWTNVERVQAGADSTICIVGEGIIKTAFSNEKSSVISGLYAQTEKPRFVSFRDHNICNDPGRVHSAMYAHGQSITDYKMSELRRFLETQEQSNRSSDKTFSTWHNPPDKSVEQRASILTGRNCEDG